MQPHEKLLELLPKVEPVEWLYDGLSGKIIPWTKEHGGTSDDPSVQAFVVARDGKVLSRCPDGQTYSASGFTKWLEEQLREYEKAYPRTALPFETATVEAPEGGPERTEARCEAFDRAREAKQPVLLYFGRDETAEDDRKARAQAKAARKFERGTLGSTRAAEAAAGWALLRFDLAEPAHRAFARRFGVEKAPALLILPGDADQPTDLGRISGASLAYHLKKHAPSGE